MHASEDTLETVYDKLTEYKQKIENGDTLDEVDDALELDVEGGQLWLHPKDDGTTVEIHLMDDTDDFNYHRERSRITNHLTRELGFPSTGKFEPFTGFFGSGRESFRVNYEYFTQ